jgi:serine/threonine-protein kinase
MLVGQQFGPFIIDKELGSGAMGAVYRGRYTATGQVVAIKIMAPGLGTTNSRAADRFRLEAEILKQLKHPNIVRLFGVGKHQGTRYFAMEYIQGESLDKSMARRGRMSWEEVITLGRQLCAALQHAHEKGIIHRDLKPSNLMVLADGTLKLTDFGIAKDLDGVQLTSANCTVGTAAYMSPEQCKGERDLTIKSDLYSMGVLLYELITGRKPFNAENAMDMFLQHVSGTFERPSRQVLELPVWLDTLICQLLEKKPEQRPLNAAMVGSVLDSIKEKVEAQQSAGVEAARRRMIDRAPGQPKADEKDREAARFLLKGKVRGRRKKKPWYEQVWVHAAALLLLLSAVVFTLVLVLKPPSADELYQRAKRLMDKNDEQAALAGPIPDYLSRYGRLDDDHTREVRGWSERAELREGEDLLRRYRKQNLDKKAVAIHMEYQNDDEKLAFRAIDKEDDGDVEVAARRWAELEKDANLPRWKLVARKHLGDLKAQQDLEKDFDEDFSRIVRDGKELPPQKDESRQAAFTAMRYERFGDVRRAEVRYKELRDKTGRDPTLNLWYLLAARKVREMNRKAERGKEVGTLIEEKLTAAAANQAAPDRRQLQAWADCLDVIALYGGEDESDDVKKQVEQARGLLRDMAQRQGRKPPPEAKGPTAGRPS